MSALSLRHRSPLAVASPAAAAGGSKPISAEVSSAVLDSRQLLAGNTRIAIRHRDETYWLHQTRQGKLLLTK